jgi:atypical dual specificity phosphatase
MSLLEALGTIVRARPTVSPNAGFLAQLKALERSLFGTLSIEADELPRKKEDRVAFFSPSAADGGVVS